MSHVSVQAERDKMRASLNNCTVIIPTRFIILSSACMFCVHVFLRSCNLPAACLLLLLFVCLFA